MRPRLPKVLRTFPVILSTIRPALLFCVVGGSVTLIGLRCSTIVPPNGWSERWGPLVPHHTFPGDCGICHVPERWDKLREDFAFDHEKETGHRLEGIHAGAACLRCHNDRGPVSVYAARGCGGCHPDPHGDTLGLDCTRCHGQQDWSPTGLIAEHARTRFPLYGVHVVVPCESCHERAPVGEYRGAPVRCELCHGDDLARATSPDHLASGWTQTCERCHTPTGWTGSNFSHNFFPLTGGHAGLACTSCHTDGTFGSLPADCYSCHRDDYERAPNHLALGYPTSCQSCHSTRSWDASLSRHPFPLTGPHNATCTTCHNAGSVQAFTCFACHEHSRDQTDPKHREVSGYTYDSNACYRCHRSGKGD
jgi:hypothetical protein